MAFVKQVSRKSGKAYRAVVRNRGQREISATFSRKKDADAWASRMERDADAARAYGNSVLRTITLADLIDEFAEAHTGKDYMILDRLAWWRDHCGDRLLIDITADIIREGLRELERGTAYRGDGRGRRKSLGRPRAGTTVNRFHSNISAVFEWARDHYGIPGNPARGIRRRPEDNRIVR